MAGIKKKDRRDLLLICLGAGATVAGVFTRNRLCAAPVILCKTHLVVGRPIRALVVNTGNANAGTGEDGLNRARAVCAETARLVGCEPEQVLPFSTGVIMEPLPVERLISGLPACVADLGQGSWLAAAEAIMTTDTLPKAASAQVTIGGATVTVTGIAKGAGMIRPNMATMLGFIATDAAIAAPVLNQMARDVADQSFNRITVDGDTSTNDSMMLIATGRTGHVPITQASDPAVSILRAAMIRVAQELAQAIVRDGEGATKFITIRVEQGRTEEECRQVAYAIGHSPLVKTAFFASDPNLGRILAAIGNAGIGDLAVDRIQLYLGDVLVAEKGGRAASYREEKGQRVMRESEITVRVLLGRGEKATTVWTCDLSYDYVKINADYRT